jgi:2-oxoglutarate ferredoxin oxidoreductase subunit alpha
MSTTAAENTPATVSVETLDDVVIRFAGDSGDGMQLTGGRFTSTSALLGNDISTLPDFPAEIRAPVGTLPGVSAFQVRIANHDIHTPGDAPDVLVAMNPAALKGNLRDLKQTGVVIVDTDEFNARNFKKANIETDPLEDGTLEGYRVYKVALTTMTRRALEDTDLDVKSKDRCKNFLALGMVYWLFSRPMDYTIEWLQKKFAHRPDLIDANTRALKAGWNFSDITGIFQVRYEVAPARLEPGTYRNIQGNPALAMGLVAASLQSGLPLFLGAYPITPASDLLHHLASYKEYGVTTFQAEDEIAAVCAAIGASFGGRLGVTASSGPGIALKAEAMNLAVMVELPLVVINVQRAGPSTGMPTKTEQSDLLQVMFGRNGESPVPVLAAASPKDCFAIGLEACNIALKYMVPVVVLTDGYLANGSEPWRLPKLDDVPKIATRFAEVEDAENFEAYRRDESTLARPWAIPGTAGLEHRVGGLEKKNVTGNVEYDPANHAEMTHLRADKVARVVQDIPDVEVHGDPQGGDLLVVGWGSTAGAITGAVDEARKRGYGVSRIHLRYLNPFPKNLGEVLRRFSRVLLPEMNMGQLALLLRAKYLVDIESFCKVEGRPFGRGEILAKIEDILGGGDVH